MQNHPNQYKIELKIPLEQIIEMRKAGFSLRHIGKVAGVHGTTISNWMKKLGIEPEYPVTYQRVPNREYAQLYYMYWDLQMSLPEISEATGIKRRTLEARMQYGGIPKRTKSEAQKLAWRKGRQDKNAERFRLARLAKESAQQAER